MSENNRAMLGQRLDEIKQEQAAICAETEAIRVRLDIVERILADALVFICKTKANNSGAASSKIDQEVLN